jgi:hypothetical protein
MFVAPSPFRLRPGSDALSLCAWRRAGDGSCCVAVGQTVPEGGSVCALRRGLP